MFFYFSTVSASRLNDNEKEAERDFNSSLTVLAKKLNTPEEQAWEILQEVSQKRQSDLSTAILITKPLKKANVGDERGLSRTIVSYEDIVGFVNSNLKFNNFTLDTMHLHIQSLIAPVLAEGSDFYTRDNSHGFQGLFKSYILGQEKEFEERKQSSYLTGAMFAALQYFKAKSGDIESVLDDDTVIEIAENFLSDFSQTAKKLGMFEPFLNSKEEIKRVIYQTFLNGVGSESNKFYLEEVKTGLTAFRDCNILDERLRPIIRYYLGEMEYLGLGGDVNYDAARAEFIAFFNDPNLSRSEKATARYYLAEMDYLGLEGDVDYGLVRAKFIASRDDPNLSPSHKATAKYRLAEMDSFGYGTDKPSYVEVITAIMAACNDPDLPKNMVSEALFRIAEIKLAYFFFDKKVGLEAVFSDHQGAKDLFEQSSKDSNLPKDKRATSRFRIGELAYLNSDYPTARDVLKYSLNDADLPEKHRAMCRYLLAKMDCLRHGGNFDLSAAREGFKLVIDSIHSTPSLKKDAQNFLSEILSATSGE